MSTRRSVAVAALGLSLALAAWVGPAAACWCRNMTVQSACAGHARLFFTGKVVSVRADGATHAVTVRALRGIRGVTTERVELRMGRTPEATEITSCDGRGPFAVGEHVIVANEHDNPTIGICSLAEVLPDERAALADPCAGPAGP